MSNPPVDEPDVNQNGYLTIEQAAKLFPVPVTPQTVRNRISKGVKGKRLRGTWTGSRWLTRPEWIDEHLAELQNRFSEHVRIVPVDVQHALDMAFLRSL